MAALATAEPIGDQVSEVLNDVLSHVRNQLEVAVPSKEPIFEHIWVLSVITVGSL